MNQRSWPDLQRLGWDLGIRRGADGQVAGIFLERIRADAAPLSQDVCRGFGFAGPDDDGHAGWRLDATATRFTFDQVKEWLPAFDAHSDLKQAVPRIISAHYVEQLYIADPAEFPLPADLSAVDGETGQQGWKQDQEAFESLVERRTFTLTPGDTVATIMSRIGAAVPDHLARQFAESAVAALRRGGNLHVIRKSGNVEWMPPFRFVADGHAPASAYADWEALVAAAEAQGLTSAFQDAATPRRSEERIDDVGEKIGGARKDFYLKGLTISDYRNMNAAERVAYLRLKNIWSFSPKEMRDTGARASVVAWLRDFRRKFDEPNPQRYSESAIENYIEVTARLAELFAGVKTLPDLMRACHEAAALPNIASIGWKATNMLEEVETGQRVERPEGGYTYAYVPAGFPHGWERWSYYYSHPEEEESLWARLLPARSRDVVTDDGPQIPQRPHLDTLRQEGLPDFRGGADVRPETLLSAFGFRGIEFGNWLPQDERQRVVNCAYDSLMALAMTLNVPPAFMSLNGDLALAFGSRGRSKAAAHYEPMRRVTNLTRLKGAGSLAHEFWHALDDWLCRHAAHIPSGNCYATDPAAEAAKKGHRPVEGAMAYGCSVGLMATAMFENASDPERILAHSAKAETHLEYAKSWIRYLLRDTLVSSRRLESAHALAEADAIIETLFQSAMARHRLDPPKLGGQAAQFDWDLAAESVLRAVKTQYGLKLPKKNQTQVELNFHTYSVQSACARILSDPDLKSAYGSCVPMTISHSDFAKQAEKLDAKRSKPYWTNPTEFGARAFESYIFDKLADAGSRIDYLVHGVEGDRFAGPRYGGNPYPAGEQRQALNQAFDRLFDAVRREFSIAPFAMPVLDHLDQQPPTPQQKPMRLAASL